jgi:hypothetical protein
MLGLGSREADVALEPLIEAWTRNHRERPPRAVAVPSESNSFFAAPLREWAKNGGVDENDAILARALKLQEKGRSSTDWISSLEMDIAALAFIEGHFEVKSAWPPKSVQTERLLQSFSSGNVSSGNADEFRLLAAEVLSDWQPEYSPAFKKRIEVALRWLDDPSRGEFPEP